MGANANDLSTEIDCTKKVSNCWGNGQIPFALPFLTLPNSNFTTLLSSPPQLLHTSFTTAADNFFRFVHSLASQNPFLNKVLSLPAEFHTLCVQVRNSKLSLSWYFYTGKMQEKPYDIVDVWVQIRKQRNVGLVSSHNFAAVLPGGSVAGLVVANGVLNFLNIYNTLLIVRLVLTWFPNTPPSIVSPLRWVTFSLFFLLFLFLGRISFSVQLDCCHMANFIARSLLSLMWFEISLFC